MLRRPLVVAGLLASCAAGPSLAQSPTLAQADSAFAAGRLDLARQRYAALLAREPGQSRAAYRLGQLAVTPDSAVVWFRRYVELEPRDPWGYMAVGNATSRLGRWREALTWYDRAAELAPEERDVAVGRFRVHSRAGRREAAIAVLGDWLSRHPDDAEGWDLLGREQVRAGRPGSAERSFNNAVALGRGGDVAERLVNVRSARAFAVEPIGAYERDSDGNRTARVGVAVDGPVADGVRVGVAGARGEIGDGVLAMPVTSGEVRLAARPHSTLRLDFAGGAARHDPGASGAPWTAATGEARLRWRAPAGGPALEVRGQRMPLGTTPLLVVTEAVRTEARGSLDLPAGPLRLRGGGRAGTIRTTGQSNTRTGVSGAVVYPVGWQGELTVQYHRLAYADPTEAGYFAPRLAETIEAGGYVELGEGGGVVAAIDLGAGAQRTAEHGALAGPWKPSLRAWGYLAVPLAPGRDLRVEFEGYNAPFAPEGVTTSSTWRFVSLSAGLRWAFR